MTGKYFILNIYKIEKFIIKIPIHHYNPYFKNTIQYPRYQKLKIIHKFFSKSAISLFIFKHIKTGKETSNLSHKTSEIH